MSLFYLSNKSNTTVKLSSLSMQGKNMRMRKDGQQDQINIELDNGLYVMGRISDNKLLLGSRDFPNHLIYAVVGDGDNAINFRGEKYVIEKMINQKDNVELNFDFVHATWRKFKVLLPDDNESFFIYLWNVPTADALGKSPTTNEIYIHYKLKREMLEINLCAPEAVSHGHRYNVEEMEPIKAEPILKDVEIESQSIVFISKEDTNVISLNDVHLGGARSEELRSERQNIVLGTFMNHINIDSRADNIILYDHVSNITIGQSKNIIVRSSCSNIEIRDSCENIYIGASSGDDENGFIKISNNCHNIILPALTAQNGQVIVESNCGSQGGSLVVESKCAQGTVLKAKRDSFLKGNIIIRNHEEDDIFLDGVDEGVFE